MLMNILLSEVSESTTITKKHVFSIFDTTAGLNILGRNDVLPVVKWLMHLKELDPGLYKHIYATALIKQMKTIYGVIHKENYDKKRR